MFRTMKSIMCLWQFARKMWSYDIMCRPIGQRRDQTWWSLPSASDLAISQVTTARISCERSGNAVVAF